MARRSMTRLFVGKAVLTLFFCASIPCGWSQTYVPFQSSVTDLRFPVGAKSRAGNGEKLLVRSPVGENQVVKLLCRVNDDLVVIRPTGEVAVIAKSHTQPTKEKFGRFTLKDIKHSLNEAGIRDYKMVWQKPFLFVHKCTDEYLEYTKAIIHSMYPGVVKKLMEWELTVTRPQSPLIVVITPNRAEFDALSKVPPEMLAYYNMRSNHVVLYEDQAFADAAPELVLKQATYTIVHEAVHQLLFNTGVQRRLSNWPQWISEGVPEYLSPVKISSRIAKRASVELPVRSVRWKKAGLVNDLRMHTLLQQQGDSGQLIQRAITAEKLDGVGYAVAWGLVHYMATRKPDEFKKYLADVSKIAPLNAIAESPVDPQVLFEKHFGTDYAGLEKSVQKHLTSDAVQKEYSDPVVNQTHYLVKRILKQGRAVSIAAVVTTSPAGAKEWKEAQEEQHKSAKFYTIVCKTRRQAESELKKLNSLGR